MCNQNIMSNKFDLKLVTTFSSYWCTAIFTKSRRSLHYVLKKQSKSIKRQKVKKRHWREEWCLPNLTHERNNNAHQMNSKDLSIKSRRSDTKGTNDASKEKEKQHAVTKTSQTSTFPERQAEKRRKEMTLTEIHRPQPGSEKQQEFL